MEEVEEAVENLRQLNDYGYSLLKLTENKLFKNPLGKEAYLLALFISSIAQVQGIICLADNKQYRVSLNQIRTLFEICVNEDFIYCHDSNVFTYYLVIKSEQEKVARVKLLHSDGLVDDTRLAFFEDRLKEYEKTMADMHPAWPDIIPGVITNLTKNTPLTLKRLDLRQRCQIVDHYNKDTENTPLTDMYDRLYPYFSDGTHANLLELTMAFDETDEVVNVDVDGSKDFDRMYRFARVAFGWQYSSIKTVKEHLIKPKDEAMPSWLRLMAKDLGIDE